MKNEIIMPNLGARVKNSVCNVTFECEHSIAQSEYIFRIIYIIIIK